MDNNGDIIGANVVKNKTIIGLKYCWIIVC